MIKKRLYILFLLFTIVTTCACNKQENTSNFRYPILMIGTPDPTVMIGEKKATLVSYASKGDYSFNNAAIDYNIGYVKKGETVTISFKKSKPDNIKVYSYVLNSNGAEKFQRKLMTEISLEYKNNKYSFIIDRHMASLLSSYYVENKTDFIGYKIIATKDKKTDEYDFVLETNSY